MNPLELKLNIELLHGESYGWALRCCSNDIEIAEDVLQTVYLKLLDGKARFDGRSSFKTWIFSVIRKTAADERRRTFLRRILLTTYSQQLEGAAEQKNPDDILHESEIHSIIGRAFAALPRRQREILHLVFYHDLSLSEAAEVIGISVGSARTHYERGKQRLRQRLQEFGDHI